MKTKKLTEVISDPDSDLVRQWMEEHGPGKPGCIPWCKEGDYSRRYEDADFAGFRGGWERDPTFDEYHGFGQWNFDPRFYNGRSRLAFSAIDGGPLFGTRMPGMAWICWKLSDYMGSSNDKRYRELKPHLRDWYWNAPKIATKLLRGHGY